MTSAGSLDHITEFPALVRYLRDELEWEIPEDAHFEDVTFSWSPREIGLDLAEPIQVTQLRPLRADQPWGVFFLDFPNRQLPVTVMRRILRGLSKRKRASANPADRAAWEKEDLLFISAVGDADDRRLSFAHFQDRGADLPTLRVIGWEKDDTVRRLSHVDALLRKQLSWPAPGILPEVWRERWRAAFTERPREAVRTAKEMAVALAALARDIRGRIKLILPREKPDGDLKQLFETVKQTLTRDLDVDKFADTYAQTIAYGLLSARINQTRERDKAHAERQKTTLGPKPDLTPITAEAAGQAMPTTNPFLKELFGSFLSAGGRDPDGAGLDFDELGVGEVVDLLNAADMEAVLLDFDKQKAGDDPVIHFYTGFLEAYDKALKVQRGVFYTPRPVVSFIVRSVDEALRAEFGLQDGLADTTTWREFVARHPETRTPEGVSENEPFVKILDPAAGTGTFLVETIEVIYRRLWDVVWKGQTETEKRRLWNEWVPRYLLPRLYGYELMMAPYAVAHLKIGLKLADTGYDFTGTETRADGKSNLSRARVFLTNAVEPAQDLDMQLAFMNEALAHEARAANDAKSRARFTVVIGNPPYSVKSYNNNPWINTLTDDYKRTVRGEESQIQGLSNDYIKFIRFSQYLIEQSTLGVVGLITGHGYTLGSQAREMRSNLAASFNRADYIDLHGSVRRGKTGSAVDEPVFEIMTGVAILVAARFGAGPQEVRLHDLLGTLAYKVQRLGDTTARRYSTEGYFQPTAPYFPFRVTENQASELEYNALPSLTEWLGTGSRQADMEVRWATGFASQQDELAIGFDPADVRQKMNDLAASASFKQLQGQYRVCTTTQWNYQRARIFARDPTHWKIIAVAYRPFDERFTILDRSVVTIVRERITSQFAKPNIALLFSRAVTDPRYAHAFVAQAPSDKIFLSNKTSTNSYVAPLWLLGKGADEARRPNLSARIVGRVATLTGLPFDDGLGVGNQASLPGLAPQPPRQASLSLQGERGDRSGTFSARDLFDWIYAVLHSPTYRERYADFLKSDFARVPLPKNRLLFAELIPLGTRLVALHLLDASNAPELADPKVRFVNNGGEARLGRFGKDVRRDEAGRVYLNANCWFATVPIGAWDHWIGGYQPAQKWLKDRAETGSKDKLKPGRVLTDENSLHYRRMIVALDETATVMAEIDQVIDRHGGWPGAFRGMTDSPL
jgi:type I restriction-modification system DNA methylase subunit